MLVKNLKCSEIVINRNVRVLLELYLVINKYHLK